MTLTPTTKPKRTRKPSSTSGLTITTVDAGFPEKFLPLTYTPAPIKVIFGGRSSGKSTGVARTLLLMGKQWPMRILCCREFHKSMDTSVHKVLKDEIYALGLQDFYTVNNSSITGKEIPESHFPGYQIRQTEFIFMGIANNSQSLKSTQLITTAWIEEAQNLTEKSWIDLEPTVRQNLPDGREPEIWLTFNPQFCDDFSWENFVLNPQEDSMVVELNYLDNPWLPTRSKALANRDKRNNFHKWENVWMGKPMTNFIGSVYEDYLNDAYTQNRICEVPYAEGYPVELYFDLGWTDMCCVWACQRCDNEIRLIDYYENKRRPASHYIDVMSSRGYPISKWVLPHDAKQKASGTGLSWEDVLRKSGKPLRILKNLSVMDGINAAREQFSRMVFDADRCARGLNCLRHYRFAEVREGDRTQAKPVHDVYSNGADAFRYLAIGVKTREQKPYAKYLDPYRNVSGRGDSWMSL